MSSLTIDEKVMLIRKMRNQSEGIRQHAVMDSPAEAFHPGMEEPESEPSGDGLRFLKYRILVCLIIFSGFFALHKMNFQIKGHKVTEINSILEENILPEKLQKSLESISQKLVEKNLPES